MNLPSILAATLLSLCTLAAHAHGRPSVVDQRQHAQAHRIADGVARGALTRREASRLVHEQRLIRRMERHARADGVVTPRERHALHHAQQAASRHIHRQAHDRQVRR